MRSTLSRNDGNGISSASTVTVPDSILDRSRMSLMSVSRSVPDEWMSLRVLNLLRREIACRVVGQLLAENQDRVERRPQFVRHVGEELGLVLRGEREFGRLLLDSSSAAPVRLPMS